MSRYKKSLSKIFATAMVATAMGATLAGCTDDIAVSDGGQGVADDSITLSLITEEAGLSTRAISDGAQVNRLYYLIYEKKEDEANAGQYTYNKSDFYHSDGKPKVYDYTQADRKDKFVVKLIPDADADKNGVKGYKIIVWVQYQKEVTADGKTTFEDSPYYDLTDFPNIKVKYATTEGANHKNNDENRDAFYASQEFQVSDKGKVLKVELKRPFAQINIGTSGWDYEGMASIQPNPKVVKYSKITVKGVADQLDLLNNRATASNGRDDLTAEYEYQVIPAYRNLMSNWDEWGEKIVGVYSDDTADIAADPANDIEEKTGVYTEANVDEEFLKISFPEDQRPTVPSVKSDGESEGESEGDTDIESYSDSGDDSDEDSIWKIFDKDGDGYADYVGWTAYDQKCIESKSHEELLYNIYTEEFKYLSMCYVLVPFDESVTDDVSRTVEIGFNCGLDPATDGGEPEDIFAGKNVIDLNNVPVKKNHRTNIIAADGTGFFMNANQLYVAIQEETFADYFRRLGATDKKWDDEGPEGDEDRNGEGLNDEFEWPEDDFDQDYGKMPLVLSKTKGFKVGFNKQDHETGDPDSNYIDIYRYSDESVTITFDPVGRYDELYTYIKGDEANGVEAKYQPTDFNFEYTLCGEDVSNEVENASGSLKSVKFDMDRLYALIGNVKPVETTLNEYETWFDPEYPNESFSEFANDNKTSLRMERNADVPVLRYYPIEFKVHTVMPSGENKFKGGDLTITIRLHTAYMFTFSSSSTDEGGEVWNSLIGQGQKATEETQSSKVDVSRNETGSYYIDAKKVAISTIGRISATSRVAADGITGGGNHRLFAIEDANIGDHFKFKGNAFANGDGHYITLHNLRENCAITVKMGRDYGQDDSKTVDNKVVPCDRALYVDWTGAHGNTAKLADNWYGYDGTNKENYDSSLPANENKVYLVGSTYRHQYDETKIMFAPTTQITDFTTPQEVLLYSYDTGYSVYWVIVSEGNDRNWLN